MNSFIVFACENCRTPGHGGAHNIVYICGSIGQAVRVAQENVTEGAESAHVYDVSNNEIVWDSQKIEAARK